MKNYSKEKWLPWRGELVLRWFKKSILKFAINLLCLVFLPSVLFAQSFEIERGTSAVFKGSTSCPGATQYRISHDLPSYMSFSSLGVSADFWGDIEVVFRIYVSNSAPLGSESVRIKYEFSDFGITLCTETFRLTIIVTGPEAPIAGFNGTPKFGTTPLTVRFTDQSSGGDISSRLWDFGDGQTSTAKNPTNTYQTEDRFNVSLKVTGQGGSDTETKNNYISVTTSPPDITASPDSFQVTLDENDSTSQILTIENIGSGNLYFSISDSVISSSNMQCSGWSLIHSESKQSSESRSYNTRGINLEMLSHDNQLFAQHGTNLQSDRSNSWLTFSPDTGTVLPGGSQKVNLTFRTTNLTTDTTYQASLIVDSNDPDETHLVIPVSLTVLPGPNPEAFFSVSPTSGFIGTPFNVDASTSRDGQTPKNLLQVRWDWDDDGTWDTEYSTMKTDSHQYFSPGEKIIKLEVKDTDGNTALTTQTINVSDRVPEYFDLLSPANDDTVRNLTPTFKWNSSFDPDIGDTVHYQIHISTSYYFNAVYTDTFYTGQDTTITLPDSLEQVTRYYWRVLASDRWRQSTFSTQKWNFYVPDLTPPSFTIGILQNPILTDDIDIYAIPSEPLIEGSMQTIVISTSRDSVAMSNIDQINRVYQGDYNFTNGGTLTLKVSGLDVWNNFGETDKSIAVQLVKPSDGGLLTSVDGQVNILFPYDAVNSSVYFTIINKDVTHESSQALKSIPSLEPIGYGYTLGPVPFSLSQKAILTFRYADEELLGYDEMKLGIYIRNESGWQYVNSWVDVDNNIVQAEIQEMGEYRMFWNSNASISLSLIPDEFKLLGNSPNPFNPETTIRFDLPKGFQGPMTLKIYNLLGKEIKTLMDEIGKGRRYSIKWDGRDNQSSQVPSGVYIYRLQAGRFNDSNKMLLLR